jgi:hypothetical protein
MVRETTVQWLFAAPAFKVDGNVFQPMYFLFIRHFFKVFILKGRATLL